MRKKTISLIQIILSCEHQTSSRENETNEYKNILIHQSQSCSENLTLNTITLKIKKMNRMIKKSMIIMVVLFTKIYVNMEIKN